MDVKAAGAFAPAASARSGSKLLNRDDAFHVEREMRRAVERVLSGLDVPERNRNRLAGIHLHVAREFSHLVRSHIRIELSLHICGDRSGVEGDVVGAAAHHDELDSITLFDREVGGLEPAGVVVVVVFVVVLVSTATCVVSAGFCSPPAHAPSESTPTATAIP